MKNLQKYLNYWLKTSQLSFQSLISTRPASMMFMAGKFIRFFFFLWFIYAIEERVSQVAGYNISELVIFFLVFNLFDLFGQLFFRGIYSFRSDVVSGNFDFSLTKPINPLFQIMTKHTDFLDVPLLIIVVIYLSKIISAMASINIPLFFLMSFSGMILTTAFHIIVASLGVITTEVDHAIMVYRDLSTMARFPVDIYSDGIRSFLTFILPIALVFTFPAKALLSMLSLGWIAFTLLFSLVFFLISLKFWNFALTKYSSASS